ncbi:MAG: hypothetical protein AB7P03_01885 [Kofleriaceae bacterium]
MRSSTILVLLTAAGCNGSGGNTNDSPGDPDAAVADLDGSIIEIPSCPDNTWCVEPSGTTSRLRSVWVIDANNVFAVGDNGTILRRSSNQWSAMASGTTENLRGVWGPSVDDLWAVGQGGTILRYDGSAWSAVTGVKSVSDDTDVEAVWGSGANDVWLAGPTMVWNWNGSTWATKGFGGILFSISGTGPDDVWVTGENSYLNHYTGGPVGDSDSWTYVNPGVGTAFMTVFAFAPNNVRAATFVEVQYTGSMWKQNATDGAVFQSIWGSSATRMWGVGGTKVGSWDGAAWTIEVPNGNTSALWSVRGIGNVVWAVGSDGLILHRFSTDPAVQL